MNSQFKILQGEKRFKREPEMAMSQNCVPGLTWKRSNLPVEWTNLTFNFSISVLAACFAFPIAQPWYP